MEKEFKPLPASTVTESSKACEKCEFHATALTPEKTMQMQCRHNLPEVIATFVPQGPGQMGVMAHRKPWPIMEEGDWCGKYKPQLQ